MRKLKLLVNVRYVLCCCTKLKKKKRMNLLWEEESLDCGVLLYDWTAWRLTVKFILMSCTCITQAFKAPSANWGNLRQGLSRSTLLFITCMNEKFSSNMQSCLRTQMWPNMINQELSGRVHTLSWAFYGSRRTEMWKEGDIDDQNQHIMFEKLKECFAKY